jgi:hypothetical protein
VRTLDTVKRRLGFVAHYTPFRPPTPGVVLQQLRYCLFSHKSGQAGQAGNILKRSESPL